MSVKCTEPVKDFLLPPLEYIWNVVELHKGKSYISSNLKVKTGKLLKKETEPILVLPQPLYSLLFNSRKAILSN